MNLFDAKTINDVNLCISQGNDVNEIVDKRTPLYFACKEGLLEVVECLLKNGANPNPSDIFMYSPICIAAEQGYLEIIKKLLDAGFELNNTFGNNNPLYIASIYGWMDIVDYLGPLSDQKNLDKSLQGACKKLQTDIVDKLIILGANINTPGDHTPFYFACKNGALSLIDKLIINGANIDHPLSSGITPLMMACQNGHKDIVKRLLELRCNINHTDNEGNTPLMFACKYGHFEIAEMLINDGCDVKCQNTNGKDALHYAKNKQNYEICKLIVSKYGFRRRRRSHRKNI